MVNPVAPWRAALQPASFRGAFFHIDADGQAGGRRGPTHEFPKRDTPFAEDMGRRARHWPVTGYVIGPSYTDARDALIAACEQEGPGTLTHPTLGTVQAKCDNYSSSESRERGGICIFEMAFVEAGALDTSGISTDSQSQVSTASGNSDAATTSALDTGLKTGSNGLVAGPV